MPRKRKSKKAEPRFYTGDTTPTVVPAMKPHTCHIPRTAKDGRIYACWCGKRFRFDATEGLGVSL